MPNPDPFATARAVVANRHPAAKAVFLGGSASRNEATPYSDLDLVVVYEHLDCAYRETLVEQGWPVETWMHDPETFAYFLEKIDGPAGKPALAHMVAKGIEITAPSEFSAKLAAFASTYLDAGPPALTEREILWRRYIVTDLVDDMRCPRSANELTATGTALYEKLADAYCRFRGLWSANSTKIPRRLAALDPAFAARFSEAFKTLFAANDASAIIRLAEDVLAPVGGFYYAGYRDDAKPEQRLAFDVSKPHES